jgi:hypothetical protein
MSPVRLVNIANFPQFTAINLMKDPGYDPAVRTIPQCVEVGLGWGLEDGKVGHNVLHARYAGTYPGSVAMANAILVGLTTGAAWTAMATFLSSTGGLQILTLRDLNTPNQPLLQNTASGAIGTSVSAALPNETAIVVTLRTAKAGRAFRGRIYLPGWATNALGTGNVIAAACVTDINAWANTIPTVFQAQGLTFVIGQHSRLAYTSGIGTPHPARAATTVDITSQSVKDNHWDTIRRRGLK